MARFKIFLGFLLVALLNVTPASAKTERFLENSGFQLDLNLSPQDFEKTADDLRQFRSSIESEVNHRLDDGWSFQLDNIDSTDQSVRNSYADNASSALDTESDGLKLGVTLNYKFD